MHNGSLKLLELLEMPKDSDITAEEALPSKLFPSDHLRIEAKFLIENEGDWFIEKCLQSILNIKPITKSAFFGT